MSAARGVLFLAAVLAAPAVFAEAPLSVEQAVKEALQHNAALNATRARQEAAEAQEKSVRGRLLPGVHVSDEYQHYDKPFGVPFGAEVFPIREQNTNTLAVAAEQPLLGLLKIGSSYRSASANADAAQSDTQATQAAVVEAVRTAFLRYFEERAAAQIAKSSEKQLDEQLDVVRSKLAAGVLTRADLLRTQVAVANAQQQEIQANVRAQVALSGVMALTGRDPSRPAELLEPSSLEKWNDPIPETNVAHALAVRNRPELAASLSRARAAKEQARAQTFALLPDVDFEAAYVKLNGQPLAPPDSLYIGLKASWSIFDWGADWYAQSSAHAQERAAEYAAKNAADQVNRDVDEKLAEARAAQAAVHVAQAAISSAEEAYRVTDALVKAGSATTTDLLDAQSALTQSRLNLTRARYELAVARVALNRTLGGTE
jgi:outer membrane protein TolC